jgi:hypothetical protein
MEELFRAARERRLFTSDREDPIHAASEDSLFTQRGRRAFSRSEGEETLLSAKEEPFYAAKKKPLHAAQRGACSLREREEPSNAAKELRLLMHRDRGAF